MPMSGRLGPRTGPCLGPLMMSFLTAGPPLRISAAHLNEVHVAE